ncbi:hypothetical protein A2856_01815 [Candidatus Uhrbacteria bacterium RIFCSPHIGHO2_01_FULL_63_20]|uniref:Serine aminopeptidase S33 domain-containing protein n=1 Tax=Candidatus Uhrbacteria bacterium RIFCSPHIGHO2_01_FULL_63_20 TaxID=1802385 RepID=A0A1F7TKA4_9BACT|nr:MAG: hypothetical protein A2856_01815 [Candidatus Uhrbacteria bacterium RIFCSPHIGHO2_01_FULL_63_20]
MERVTFVTEDGVEIVGDWYPSEGGRFAILLHIRPATKESWRRWAEILQARGVSVLAYDQRGHGESTMGGTIDFEKLSDDESRAKRLDLEAAYAWLQGKGATESDTFLMGGSIGANLSIRFLAEHPGVKRAVALSPGLDYRGVTTDDAIRKLSDDQRVILIASDDDQHDSFASCAKLNALAPERTTFLPQKGLGHGTNMLEEDPALFDMILTRLSL